MIKGKPRLTRRPIRRGQPISREGTSETIRAIVRAIENLDIEGGEIVWTNGKPLIRIKKQTGGD